MARLLSAFLVAAALGSLGLAGNATADPIVDERCIDVGNYCIEVLLDPTDENCGVTLFVWPVGGIWCMDGVSPPPVNPPPVPDPYDPLVDENCIEVHTLCIEVYVDPTNEGCRATLFVWPIGGIFCLG